MLFNSPVFLLFFLPIVLLTYFAVGKKYKNIALFLFSLIFYAWGAPVFLLLLLVSITANYFLGKAINKKEALQRKMFLIISVIFNAGVLLIFRYAEFFTSTLRGFFSMFWMGLGDFIPIVEVALPLGITFYTLRALSYIFDVYRKKAPVQNNFISLGLYISMFPHMIAGPIIKYEEFEKQLPEAETRFDDIVYGLKRFTAGLAKKVLIAGNLAVITDEVFSLGEKWLSIGHAWIGLIAFALQIYYDFSGYSDMAIGIARIFGYKLPENFNFPYIATSVRGFWSRWHITFTSWILDYLYAPLENNRKSDKLTILNLFIVSILFGLFHGASWAFLIWGIYQGILILFERTRLYKKISNIVPVAVNWLYTTFTVLMGWLLFRCESFEHMRIFVRALFGFGYYNSAYGPAEMFNIQILLVFISALLLAVPFTKKGWDLLLNRFTSKFDKTPVINETVGVLLLVLLFFFSVLSVSNGNIDTFIYFRL